MPDACRWSSDYRCRERMVCMWSEMNEAKPIESAAVAGVRKHVPEAVPGRPVVELNVDPAVPEDADPPSGSSQ